MALAVRGKGSTVDDTNNQTSIVVTPDVAAQLNDLILLFVAHSPLSSGNYSTVASSGFAEHAAVQKSDWQDYRVLQKLAGGSEPSSYTVTFTGGGMECAAVGCLIISGVDTSTPLPTTATTVSDATNNTSFDIPSITIANNNSWWVAAVANGGINNISTVPSLTAWGASLAEDLDNGVHFTMIGVAHLSVSTGATGTTTATYNGAASDSSLGISIEVKEGAGVPTIASVQPWHFITTQTGILVTGAGFEASQGTGNVIISPTDDVADAGIVNQTVTAWGANSVTFTAVRSALTVGTTLYLFVKNNTGDSNVSGIPVRFDVTGTLAWIRA